MAGLEPDDVHARGCRWWLRRITAVIAVLFLGAVLLLVRFCEESRQHWNDGGHRLELHFGWDPNDDRLTVEEFLWKNRGLDNSFVWKLRIVDQGVLDVLAVDGWVRLEPAGREALGPSPESEAPWWGAEAHAAEGETWRYSGDQEYWRIWYDPTTDVAYIAYEEW